MTLTVHRINDLTNEEKEQFSDVQENQVSSEILQKHLAVVRSHYESGRLLLEMNGALALFTLLNSKACRSYLKARYTTIYIDEYQDAGLEQHELFLQLQKLGLIAIAVGDANQSIFKFSGKDPKHLLDLASRKEFKTFPISFNHRCHLSITDYSLRLFDTNYTPSFSGASQVYHGNISGDQSAIPAWIEANIGIFKSRFDVSKNSEIAVLVRSTKSGELADSVLTMKHRFVRPASCKHGQFVVVLRQGVIIVLTAFCRSCESAGSFSGT